MPNFIIYTTPDTYKEIPNRTALEVIPASDINSHTNNFEQFLQSGEQILSVASTHTNGVIRPPLGFSKGTVELASGSSGTYIQDILVRPIPIKGVYTNLTFISQIKRLYFGNYQMWEMEFRLVNPVTSVDTLIHKVVSPGSTPGTSESSWPASGTDSTIVFDTAIPSDFLPDNPEEVIGIQASIRLILKNTVSISPVTQYLSVTRSTWYGLNNWTILARKV